jgi:hypothetical protein
MFPSKEQRIQRWSVTRKKGMGHFILLHGVIRWGVSSAVLFLLINLLIRRIFSLGVDLASDWPLAFVLFPVGGVLWGWSVWRMFEAEFLAAQKRESV